MRLSSTDDHWGLGRMGSLVILISLLLYAYIAWFLERSNFSALFSSIVLLFLTYVFLLKRSSKSNLNALFWVGVLYRVVFVLSLPNLSDDYYRFIWDGNLLTMGVDPYSVLPSDFAGEMENKELLLERMNSPNYYSVYPPVLQYVFALSTSLFPSSIMGAVFAMKMIILLVEITSFFLLKKLLLQLSLKPSKALLYFLNPLIIVEFCGNLHFEALMIFFSLLAIHLFMNARKWLSALSLAAAFLSKLIPLLLLPLFWRRSDPKTAVIYTLIFSISSAMLFLPITDLKTVVNISQSLDLYFQTFEFNASFYYLFRYLGFEWKGYNVIQTLGPILAVFSSLGFVYFLLYRKSSGWVLGFQNLLFALTIYYFLSTTVHPWYISFLLLLSLFTNYLYPVLWSLLVFLSYSAYSTSIVQESMWILAIEYLFLISFIIYELRLKGSYSNYVN